MKKSTKIVMVVLLIMSTVWGHILSHLFLPAFLLATNTLKGNGNNPEGEMFVSLGWLFMVILAIITLALLIWCIILSVKNKKTYLIIAFLLCLGIGISTGILAVNTLYYDNYTRIF